MADDTQPQPQSTPDPTAIDPALLNRLVAQTLSPQPVPSQQGPSPSSHEGRTWVSLLGEALGGGQQYGTTDQRESGGLAALGAFGSRLSQASDYSQQRHTLTSLIGQGMQGASEALGQRQAVTAAQQSALLDYQQKQQEMQLARIKEALPLLTLQQQLQSAAAARNLAGRGTPTTIAGAGTGGIGAVGGNTYEDAIGAHEGTGANPNSTAVGAGQFLASTWQGFANANPDLFKGMSPQQVLDARNDPALGRQAITWLAQQNADQLTKAGVTPSGPALGVAHYLGASAAAKVMAAPDNAPISSFVSDAAVKANPELATMTVGQLKQRYAGVPAPSFLGGPKPGAGPVPAVTAQTPPAGPTAAQALPVPPIPPAQPPAVRASPLPAGRPTGPPIITDQPPAGSATVAGPPGTATVGQPLPPSPAVAGNVNAIIGGMTGAGANAATLAPGPSAAAPAAPAPAVLTAQQRPPPSAPQLPPQAEPTPAAEVTGPPPPTTPDLLNFKPVRGPLPPDIQARIDNPLPPDVKQQLDNAITTALPDKVQEAIDARTKATIEARATAIAQAEAYHKEDAARQIELAKTVAAQQAAIAAEQAKNAAAERASILSSQQTRINADAADLGKRNSEIDATYGNNAQAGTNVRASVAQVRPLLQNLPGATSLLTSETARPIAAAIFGNADQRFADKATNADLFVGAMNRAADAMSPRATAGTERPSNINQYKAMLPSLVTSPEGKELALNYVDDIAKNQQDNHEWLVTHAEDPAFLNKRLNTPNRALAEIAMRKDPTQQMPQLPPMPSTFDAKAYMASPQDQKSEAKYTQSVIPGRDFYMWRAGSDGRMHAIKNTWTQGQGGSYTVVPGSPP